VGAASGDDIFNGDDDDADTVLIGIDFVDFKTDDVVRWAARNQQTANYQPTDSTRVRHIDSEHGDVGDGNVEIEALSFLSSVPRM
jgi:hypothetical protein